MNQVRTVIGVDPGPLAGLAMVQWVPDTTKLVWEVAQATPHTALLIIDAWRKDNPDAHLVYEKYVVGNRSVRAGSPKANQITRDMAGALEFERGSKSRSASEVKPWAADERLKRAGVWEQLQSMRHAKDAARHALFASVWDLGLTDPLSKHFKGS